MTKLEAPRYNNFLDILITNFQRQNLQRAIIEKSNFLYFLSGYLFMIYPVTKIEASSLIEVFENLNYN